MLEYASIQCSVCVKSDSGAILVPSLVSCCYSTLILDNKYLLLSPRLSTISTKHSTNTHRHSTNTLLLTQQGVKHKSGARSM